MGNDGKNRPLWPGELADILGENKTLNAEEIAESAGVSRQAIAWALSQMEKEGLVQLALVPVCLNCGAGMGSYPEPDHLPDEVTCLKCGQCHHISELDVRVQYVATRKE